MGTFHSSAYSLTFL